MLKWTNLLTRYGNINLWPKQYDCKLLKLGPDTLDKINDIKSSSDFELSKTILLLDSLDEDPKAWGNIDVRLKELLEQTQDFSRVFISCRTQFFPDTQDTTLGDGLVDVGNVTCHRIFLSVFDEGQVTEYLSKCFPDSLSNMFGVFQNKRRIEAGDLLKSMKDLMFRPLLLSYITLFPRKNENETWDGYRVFDALTDEWLKQEAQKLAKKEIYVGKDELRAICIAIAVDMQLSNARTISLAKIEKIITAIPHAKNSINALDFGGRSLMNRTSDGQYRFSHYIVQEFLVVYAIIEGNKITSKIRATAQMLEFARCRLNRINVPEFLKLLDLSDIKPSQWAGWLFFREALENHSDFKSPEMVVIPGGEFFMGSPRSEEGHDRNEEPLVEVRLKPFAMGRYAVTFEDYDRFCDATQRTRPDDNGWGRQRQPVINVTYEDAVAYCNPVINVTYEDAVAYCNWLSKETGAEYRLPSEAEWEYAARALTKTAFWWGDKINTRQANYNGTHTYGSGSTASNSNRQKTLRVGAFDPNPFGLYQVHGNVWEWVEDFWHENYEGAPSDGSAWRHNPWTDQHGDTHHVVRGGSFYNGPAYVRSATRDKIHPKFRANYRGFRVARTLDF